MATSSKKSTGARSRSASSDAKISIAVAGKTYTLEFTDIDGIEARAFRQATGFSIRSTFEQAASGVLDELEAVAGVVWLVRRREEPSLSYDDVLGSITYGDLLEEATEENPPV